MICRRCRRDRRRGRRDNRYRRNRRKQGNPEHEPDEPGDVSISGNRYDQDGFRMRTISGVMAYVWREGERRTVDHCLSDPSVPLLSTSPGQSTASYDTRSAI